MLKAKVTATAALATALAFLTSGCGMLLPIFITGNVSQGESLGEPAPAKISSSVVSKTIAVPSSLQDNSATPLDAAIQESKKRHGGSNDYRYQGEFRTIGWAISTLKYPNVPRYDDAVQIVAVTVTGRTNPSIGIDVSTGALNKPSDYGYYYEVSIYKVDNLDRLYTFGNYGMSPDVPTPADKPTVSQTSPPSKIHSTR